MLIYLSEDWLFSADQSKNNKIPINITFDEWQQISIIPEFMAWKYIQNEDKFILVDLLDLTVLRDRRQKECFNIIDNKSKLWWESLSEDDLAYIKQWYHDWLDVTKTLKIPELPQCLK